MPICRECQRGFDATRHANCPHCNVPKGSQPMHGLSRFFVWWTFFGSAICSLGSLVFGFAMIGDDGALPGILVILTAPMWAGLAVIAQALLQRAHTD